MKDNFFGREEQLEVLRKRIAGLKDGYRQNLAIIGDELVGKTSLIFQFLKKFCDTKIIAIYLEIRPESLSVFARRFIGVLLYNFLTNSAIPLKEDLDFLIRESGAYIPRTIEKINLILASLEKRKKNNIFAELLSLCDSINQETGKSCLVIMDEFHNLENLGIKNLYAEWSKLLIAQKTTLYIVISSRKYKARAILAKNLSLLFGNFEILTIEPFPIRTCEEYLEYSLKDLNLTLGWHNFLVHFTGGFPFYLQIITHSILKSNQQGLADILEDLLFEPAGILNQKFSNYLKRFLESPNSQDYIAILHQISCGRNKLKDIAHALRKPKSELSLRINHLLELDAITRSGDFFTLNDRVFSFWLKFVYQEKLRSLTFNAENQKAFFRDNIEGMIQEFFISAQKPFTQRLVELLRLFEDDNVQIEKKKLRLDHLREIKPLSFSGKSLKEGLIGRSTDSVWIVAFKRDIITEEDVTEFSRECKRYRHKLQKKIIVTFQDVEANARLRALEEKIWTWDLNSVNRILDLYSKPRIIA